MITKKFNFHLLINILLISSFSLIHGSNKTEQEEKIKKGMLGFIKNSSKQNPSETQPALLPTVHVTAEPVLVPQRGQNKKEEKSPSNLTVKQQEDAAKINEYLEERNKRIQEFDVVEKEEPQAAQPVLTETTAAMPAISPDSLGMPYTHPSLPAQTAKTVTTSRGLFSLTAIEDFLNQIIDNREFQAAHANGKKQYPKIGEDSGEALTANVTAFIAMLTNQNKEKTDLFKKHRQEFATFSNRLRRLVLANQEPYAKGSISQQRIEGALKNLEEIQKIFEQSNNPLVLELDAKEKALEDMRKEILALHPTAASQPQIFTKRKLIIEEITQRSETRK